MELEVILIELILARRSQANRRDRRCNIELGAGYFYRAVSLCGSVISITVLGKSFG